MRAGECAAIKCGMPIGGGHFMCRQHWHLVPADLRARLKALDKAAADGGAWAGHAVARYVARALAIRWVALDEGTLAPSDDRREAMLTQWRKVRADLIAALGGQTYAAEVVGYRARLRRLLAESGAHCPLDAAQLAIQFDSTPDDAPGRHATDARRIAAALDEYERNH